MGDESDPLTVTACQFTTATILILPAVTFVWVMHVETAPSHVATRFWFAAIFVGVIGYAASFVLYNYAIARVRAAPASIIVNLIPVFGLASAVFWLGDSLTVARVLGAILIGLSVTIFTATELAEARSDAKANVTPDRDRVRGPAKGRGRPEQRLRRAGPRRAGRHWNPPMSRCRPTGAAESGCVISSWTAAQRALRWTRRSAATRSAAAAQAGEISSSSMKLCGKAGLAT